MTTTLAGGIGSRWLLCIGVQALMVGCSVSYGVDDDDQPAGEECTDPKYGDGTCDLALACAAPDIDCFRTFDSQEEAEDWYAALEVEIAPLEDREVLAIVPSSDARFSRMRDILDRTWQAYARARPVGDLAASSPALVLVEQGEVNAFVAPESAERQRQALAVMVHTGTLDADLTDIELTGLIAHELTHAIGLHGVEDVKIQLRRYYMAGGEEEPYGFEQTHDPSVQTAIEAWTDMAEDVGPFTDPALAGFAHERGHLQDVLLTALMEGADGSDPACRSALEAYDAFNASLAARYSELEVGYDFTGIESETAEGAVGAVNGLISNCLADYTTSFVDLIARMSGVTVAQVREGMEDADEAIVDGKHILVALWDFHLAIRSRMRSIETDLESATGVPWTGARYFSHEEMADDFTIPVLEAADLPVGGGAEFLMTLLDDDVARDGCEARMAAGPPAYGDNLSDAHHATCWRVSHVRQLASDRDRLPSAALAGQPRTAPVPLVRRSYRPLFPARTEIRIH